MHIAGLAIYRAALADPAVQRVTLLTRRPLPSWAELPANATEKTEVILHSDFKTYPPDLARRLATENDATEKRAGTSPHSSRSPGLSALIRPRPESHTATLTSPLPAYASQPWAAA